MTNKLRNKLIALGTVPLVTTAILLAAGAGVFSFPLGYLAFFVVQNYYSRQAKKEEVKNA